MLVLFDNGTPRTLARFLIDRHMVTEARARGWEELENGELLKEDEAAGVEVLVVQTGCRLVPEFGVEVLACHGGKSGVRRIGVAEFVREALHEAQGVVPEGLDFDGLAIAGGDGPIAA